MLDPWPTVFATAHRRVPRPAERWTRDNLAAAARWLKHNRGTSVGISGMARGGDLWWAQAVLAADLDLWAFIPFEEQPAGWSRRDQADWEAIRAAAAEVRVIGEIPAGLSEEDRRRTAVRLLWARNHAMLDAGDAAVGVWIPGRRQGGTHGCLSEAARRGLPGIHIDPQAPGVRHRLPTLAELGPRASPWVKT